MVPDFPLILSVIALVVAVWGITRQYYSNRLFDVKRKDIAQNLEAKFQKTVDDKILDYDRKLDAYQQKLVSKFAAKESEFDLILKKKYNEAVEKINFSVVEYKSTIQKKRRKIAKNLKPSDTIWRTLGEEEPTIPENPKSKKKK